MKLLVFFNYMILGAVMAGCDDFLTSNIDKGDTFSEHMRSDNAKEVIMTDPETFDRDDWPRGSYNVNETSFDRDRMQINVIYSSYEQKEFDMVFWNWFMESIPVQAYAILAFDQDECEAIVTDTLYFDLTPLKEKYQEFYGTEGKMDISIVDRGEKHARFRYQFEE